MAKEKSGWTKFWESIKGKPRVLPQTAMIEEDHVDGESLDPGPIKDGDHYFAVHLNEMFLDVQRKWFATYDPMVLSIAEFMYDNNMTTVPYLVGPQMLEQHKEQVPEGMIFTNTRTAGIHPYKGGKFTLTMVLNRIKREDYARKILQLVEGFGNTMDFANTLSAYTKLSGAILDGVECLLGLDDCKPLVGWRFEFDPDFDDEFKARYFALVDAPEKIIDQNKLFVKKKALYYGDDLATAKPFREASYVLYSLKKTGTRSDEEMLSFYPTYKNLIEKTCLPDEDGKNWKTAKAMMLTLYNQMLFHPDLTPKHADELLTEYVEEMKKVRQRVLALGELDVTTKGSITFARPPEPEVEVNEATKKKLEGAVDILDLE